MSIYGHQAAQHYDQLSRQAGEILGRYREIRQGLEQERAQIDAQLQAARQELAAIYLPALTVAALESAEQLTGFRGFSRRSPLKARENEEHRLRESIDRITASELYQRRRALVGEHGEYTRALQEAREMLEPWQAECARFEDLEGFNALVTLGYDTPAYQVRWWEPSYWRYWAQGDAVCDALEMDDFGDDVLPAYEKARAPRDQWRAQVEEAEQKILAVHTLLQNHDQLVSRLQQLDAIYLTESQAMLAGHLELADPGLLAQWSGEDRGVVMALRRIAGLSAKIDFLRDAVDGGLDDFISDMEARQRKFQRKASKYRRSKHYHRQIPDREIDRRFSAKVEKYSANGEKLALIAERVVRYERYDRFELDNPPELWFHEFTGGKRPSRLTPSLRTWYERNPNQTPQRDPSVETARLAKAAPAADRLDDLGYLS